MDEVSAIQSELPEDRHRLLSEHVLSRMRRGNGVAAIIQGAGSPRHRVIKEIEFYLSDAGKKYVAISAEYRAELERELSRYRELDLPLELRTS